MPLASSLAAISDLSSSQDFFCAKTGVAKIASETARARIPFTCPPLETKTGCGLSICPPGRAMVFWGTLRVRLEDTYERSIARRHACTGSAGSERHAQTGFPGGPADLSAELRDLSR